MTGQAAGGQTSRPMSRRRMATWLCVGFGALLIVAFVIVSLITGSPFSWAGLLLIGGIIFMLFAGFVWVRLAE